jgi:branched-chain amino acid transport system substrate-binding protein
MFQHRHGLKITFALGSLLLLANSPDIQAETGVTKDEIVIGSFGPLTGPVYMFGALSMNGIDAMFDKVNEAGGLYGRKLRLVRENDFCQAEPAIGAVKKLIHVDKVFAIHGGACTNGAVAAKPEIVKEKIPFVIFGATADELTDPPTPGVFTTQMTSTIEGRAQLKHVAEKGYKKIAIVSQRDAWGRSRYVPMAAMMKAQGITPVAEEEISIDAVDATPQVLRLRNAQPDAVLLLLFPKQAAVLIRDAHKLGVRLNWVGTTAINDLNAFRDQVGGADALKGFVTLSALRHLPTDPEMTEWSRRIKKLFPNDTLSVFNQQGIGSAEIVVEALRRAGPDLTREKFVAALASIKDYNTEAFAGPMSCATHQCNQIPAWLTLVNGKAAITSGSN